MSKYQVRGTSDIYLNGHCALLSLDDIHGGIWHIYKLAKNGNHITGDRLHVVNDRDRAIDWIEAQPAPVPEYRISLNLVRLTLARPAPGTICAAVSASNYHPIPTHEGTLIFGLLTIYSLR